MKNIHIYKNLGWLNGLSVDEAEAAFRDCCGSQVWARRMARARPFAMLESLFETAEGLWYSLSDVDWLEAFSTHPRIGSSKAAPRQQAKSAEWSSGEQAGVAAADDDVRDQLAEANRLYQERFGFIFIVCATGRSADEILAVCRARLGNSAEAELEIAAAEQHKITEIRLNKLLEQ